jgi:hypothetical protein
VVHAAEQLRAAPGAQGRRGTPGGLRVAAAQQFTAVPAGLHRIIGPRRIFGGRPNPGPDVFERRQHPVCYEHGRAEPAEHVRPIQRPRRPRFGDRVLDAETAGDHARDDDVGMVGEPVRAGAERHAGRRQRGGDQPAVLASGRC